MRSPELSRRAALAAFAAAAAAPRSLWAAPTDGAAAGLAAGGLGPAADFSLCNATLLSHLGGVQTGGVRVERGRIVEVGPQVTSGEDLGGAWLCPGFTDAGCTLGMYEIDGEPGTRDDGDKPAVTADARAIDGYNPLSETIPVARAEGVTTALVTPASCSASAGPAPAARGAPPPESP
jgi:imidazolonepropionase-like amidohydrolase